METRFEDKEKEISKENNTANTEVKEEKFPFSPLEKHIKYHGGGIKITTTSIYNKNRDLGDSRFEALTNASTVATIATTKIRGCPWPMFFYSNDAIGVLNHSHHTGIYKPNGYIDEEVWKELQTYSAENENGETILKKSKFYEFLNARREKEGATDTFGKVASDGEWNKYWLKFGKNMKDDQFVLIKDLRTYFEDSEVIGKELEERLAHKI